tara:strand:+ start:63 stop:542 length:480 start_codon:yes stop_codon:yes gene_type:complete
MTIYLFLLLVVASFLSSSVSLLMAGVTYAFLSFLHFWVFVELDAVNYGYYYASASAFDCVCAIGVCMAATALEKDWHLFPLSLVMVLSMFVNMGGLFIWYYGWDSTMYKIAGVTVYLLAATILLGSSLNVGRLLGLNRFGPLHFIPNSDSLLLDRRKKD